MQDYIYLVIIQTGTRPARFFKLITKKPYNHVSLAADLDLSEMYSFCRTYRRSPFPATFNKEIVGEGTLGLFGFIPCEIYSIPVTHHQKLIFREIIKHFSLNRDLYSYNVLGLPAVFFHIAWNRKKNFLCSQFVAFTMEKMGLQLEKPFCLYTPDDFREFPGANLVYHGELNSFYYGRHEEQLIGNQ